MLKSSGITVGGGGWSPFVNDIASCPFVDNSIHGNAMATTHITLFISITVVITADLCLTVPSMIKHLPVAKVSTPSKGKQQVLLSIGQGKQKKYWVPVTVFLVLYFNHC